MVSGISLFTPTWYDITQMTIIDATANLGYVVNYIKDSIYDLGKNILETFTDWGTSLTGLGAEDEDDEANWDEFKVIADFFLYL